LLIVKPEVRQGVTLSLLLLVWIGLGSISASGFIAGGMAALLGPAFVAGDLPGSTYTAERCADLQEYAPSATTCAEAAAIHHADEVVTYRIAAGVLALPVLGAWWLARSRWRGARVPPTLTSAAGLAAFGVVGLALTALALNAGAQGMDTGVGAYLSAAVVAIPLAALFARRLYLGLARY